MKMKRNSKQTIELCLNGGKGRVPFAPFLDYYWDFLPEEVQKRGKVAYCHEELHCDALLRGFAAAYRVDYGDTEIKETVTGDRKRVDYVSSAGKLTFGYTYAPVARSWFLRDHPIKEERDFEVFIRILERAKIADESAELNRRYREIGDSALAVPIIGVDFKSAFQNLVEHWCGIESLAYAMLDFPELVEEALKLLKALNRETVEATAKTEAGFAISWEDSSTMLTSPDWYETYIVSELNDWCDILHAHGKKYILHACGHIQELLPIIAESKIDVLESITPSPTGDADLRYANKILPPHVAVIGGIGGVVFEKSSPGTLKQVVHELFDIFKDRPFVLSNSDSCPPDVPKENFRAVIETLAEIQN